MAQARLLTSHLGQDKVRGKVRGRWEKQRSDQFDVGQEGGGSSEGPDKFLLGTRDQPVTRETGAAGEVVTVHLVSAMSASFRT